MSSIFIRKKWYKYTSLTKCDKLFEGIAPLRELCNIAYHKQDGSIGHSGPAELKHSRLVTLLELLEINAYAFVYASQYLLGLRELARSNWWRSQDPLRIVFPYPKDHDPIAIKKDLEFIHDTFVKCELPICAGHISELLELLDHGGEIGTKECEALLDNLTRELSTRMFLGIPYGRVASYADSLKGWESTVQAFPGTSEDIEEMNKLLRALTIYSLRVSLASGC